MSDTRRLDGQVAIVTGGAQGLGRRIALVLAEAGENWASKWPFREVVEEALISIAGPRYRIQRRSRPIVFI